MVVRIRASVQQLKLNQCPLVALEVFVSGLRWPDGASAWDLASALEINLRATVTKKHLIKLDAINFALNQFGEQHTSA